MPLNCFCEVVNAFGLHDEKRCDRFHIKCEDRAISFSSENGRIQIDQTAYRNRDINEFNKESKRTLILVMESPHIKEYEGLPMPAMGPTGENIIRYLNDVILQIEKNFDKIILMNAVQFQCSLGDPTNTAAVNSGFKYRLSEIFVKCWNDKSVGAADFERRLGKYIKETEYAVIINACTNGENGHRKILVRSAILNVTKKQDNYYVYETGHPFSWVNPRNRRLVMVS